MKLPKYHLKAEKSLMLFEFVSEGPKGHIPKLVKFSETNLFGIYNLAFGDKDHKTGEINDTVISNNGDSEKFLRRLFRHYTLLLISIRTLLYWRPEVRNHGHGSTEWE